MAFEKFSNICDAMSYTGHRKFHLMFLYHKDSKKVWKTPRKKRRIRIMALSNFKQTLFSFQLVTHRLEKKNQIDGYSEPAKSAGYFHMMFPLQLCQSCLSWILHFLTVYSFSRTWFQPNKVSQNPVHQLKKKITRNSFS